ncbi:hypothetical protein JW964_14250, partial [candidate division KSB1 bacterium]|nr:hypothetical protein [candidate division KSB1 bacterium]
SEGTLQPDTLQLQAYSNTSADLMLKGEGFFPGTEIQFDDPNIQVLNDPQHRLIFPPDSMLVGLMVDVRKPPAIGLQKFRIKNPFTLEGEGRLLVRSAFSPKITGTINNYIPDGAETLLEVNGINFVPGSQVSTIPESQIFRTRFISTQKIELYLTLPIQQENTAYRIQVVNPDGQSAVSNYFFAMAKPLAPARAISATKRELFCGREELIEIVVRQRRLERLNPKNSYEINFGADRFPIERIKDDSTLVGRVIIPNCGSDTPLNYHNFTVKEVGQPAQWKGTLVAKAAPVVSYMTPNRIIHPMDTLQVMLKGAQLSGVKVTFDEPDVAVEMLEAADDRLRFKIIAGREISYQKFSLVLEKGNVKFEFPAYQIQVQEWEPFNRFIALETPVLGKISPQLLWSGKEQVIKIKSGDFILVKFYGRDIRSEAGIQKIHVTGFLLDSVNTIRAEAIENSVIKIGPGNEIITWRFRVRQQVRSGDRIEIVISNPGNQKRSSEYFYVERKWHEAFRGSTSIALLKIPMSSNQKKTEILNNIAFGINWIPWVNRKFISFDGSFLIGNPATTDSTVNLEIGLGFSAIILNHIQIGIGTNLTGDSFSDGFIFLGTRFKLPFPK